MCALGVCAAEAGILLKDGDEVLFGTDSKVHVEVRPLESTARPRRREYDEPRGPLRAWSPSSPNQGLKAEHVGL